MAARYDPSKQLPDVEKALVCAELKKPWEMMNPENCETEEGRAIVEYERRQRFHRENN